MLSEKGPRIKFNIMHWVLLIGTVVSFFVCVLHQIDKEYNIFEQWVLPAGFMVCLIIFPSNNKYLNNYSLIIINILMFIRYSISPLSYYITYSGILHSTEYQNESLCLMLYEMITVFICIEVFAPKMLKENEQRIYSTDMSSIFKIPIGTIIMTVIFILVLIIYPQFFKQMFNFNFGTMTDVEVDSSIQGFYHIVYRTGIITIACTLFSYIHKRIEKQKSCAFTLSLVLTIVCIWIASQGSKGQISRTAFLTNGIIFFLILVRIYPNRKKIIFNAGLISVFILLIVGTMIKFSYGNGLNFESISNTLKEIFDYEVLDSYFGGIEGVNVSLRMASVYKRSITYRTLFIDIFGSIPYIATRSGINLKNIIPVYFNFVFFGYSGNVTKICPYIGQGHAFFGYIFSPIFSVLCTYFAFLFNRKLKKADDELSFYVLALCVYFFGTFVMYNLDILFNNLWTRILPIAIVMFLNKLFCKRSKNYDYLLRM